MQSDMARRINRCAETVVDRMTKEIPPLASNASRSEMCKQITCIEAIREFGNLPDWYECYVEEPEEIIKQVIKRIAWIHKIRRRARETTEKPTP